MNKTITKLFLFLLVTFFGTNFAWADFSFNEIELKFAQVSDVHTSDAPDTEYKVLSHSKELFCDAIKTINNIKGLDFVIFTGDMVNLPDKNSYRDFFLNLTKLRYPSLLVLGNHDSAINNDSEEYLDKTTVHGVIRKYNPYQNYDNPYFAFSPNPNYRVIVLDTTVGMGAKTSNGFLPDEQLAFLDNEIAQNQDKVILIFQHHPVIEPFKSNDHKLLNAGAYTEIFKKYEKVPIAVFAGHYHASKIVRKGNVIYVASPALVTYPNAFRTVDITDYKDRVIFKFKFHETNLKDIQVLLHRLHLAVWHLIEMMK